MLVGIKKLESQLDSITNAAADKWALECGLLVEERAKELCPRDTGELANSINTEHISEGEVSVGTSLGYGVFVHEGTGIYNSNTTRPGGVYWVYVKTPGSAYAAYKEANSGKSKSYATLEEARKVVAILRSQGIDAYYTNGQKPQPFLTNALQEQAPLFNEVLDKVIKEAL